MRKRKHTIELGWNASQSVRETNELKTRAIEEIAWKTMEKRKPERSEIHKMELNNVNRNFAMQSIEIAFHHFHVPSIQSTAFFISLRALLLFHRPEWRYCLRKMQYNCCDRFPMTLMSNEKTLKQLKLSAFKMAKSNETKIKFKMRTNK